MSTDMTTRNLIGDDAFIAALRQRRRLIKIVTAGDLSDDVLDELKRLDDLLTVYDEDRHIEFFYLDTHTFMNLADTIRHRMLLDRPAVPVSYPDYTYPRGLSCEMFYDVYNLVQIAGLDLHSYDFPSVVDAAAELINDAVDDDLRDSEDEDDRLAVERYDYLCSVFPGPEELAPTEEAKRLWPKHTW